METSPGAPQTNELGEQVAATAGEFALSEYFNNLKGQDQIPFTD